MMSIATVRIALAVVLSGLLASSPARADSKDDLSLIPTDSELVGGLDFQGLQASELWKQLVGPMLAKQDVQQSIAEFQADCGVDPMKVVTKLAFGIKGLGSPQPDGVIIAHGVPKANLVGCFDKLTKKKKQDVTITRDGDVMIFKRTTGSTAFTYLDDSTALIVVGTQATSDGVKAIAKGSSALATSAAFKDLYKATNTTDTLWIIINGSSTVFEPLAKAGVKPKAVYGSLNVTKDLTIDMKVRMKDPSSAQNLAKLINEQVAPKAAMFDKIAITADGSDVKAAVLLTDAKLKNLARAMAGTKSQGSAPAKAPPPAAKPAAPKPAASGCDEVGCVLNNYDSACCAKYKKR